RLISILGLFLFWVFRARLDLRFWTRFKVWQKLLIALGVIWIADRALAAPYVGDSYLYHFSSVRWATEYRLPPGLGNLHGRLAFNQSYFLFVSFLNLLPRRWQGHNFANSLLLVFALITTLERAGEFREKATKTINQLLGPLLIFLTLLANKKYESGVS